MENTESTPSTNPEPSRANGKNHRFTIFGGLQTFFSVAIIAATVFTLFTPANLFSTQLLDQIYETWQSEPTTEFPTPTAQPPIRIGIVAGHYGNDSGSVCADGWAEMEANLTIASLVQQKLRALNYEVDLLEEFDSRLYGYKAQILVSIHNDSCEYINDEATGFKVATFSNEAYPEKANRLLNCMVNRYGLVTSLPFHYNTITPDMTSYHTFNEIDTSTTAAIIEAGFMNLDQDLLRNHPDVVADGIVAGIMCYVRNESVPNSEQP